MAFLFDSIDEHDPLAREMESIEKHYSQLLPRAHISKDPDGLWPDKLLAFNTDVFLQVGLRRALELAESIAREVNADAFASVWVLSRALMEVSALMCDAAMRAESATLQANRGAFQEFSDHLFATMMGFKSMEWAFSEDVVIKNLLTAVDRVQKRIPQFRSMYDLLSEGAHPNYIGMLEAYQLPGPEGQYIEHPGEISRKTIDIPVSAVGTLLKAIEFALDIWARVRPRMCEMLPALAPSPAPEPRPKPNSSKGAQPNGSSG